MALLGRKTHTAGNTIRYVVDYTAWLADGESLSAGTVTKDAASSSITDIVISLVSVTPSANEIVFTLSGGSVNETFTVDVQATNSRGEIKKDTASFSIVAP